MWYFLSSLNIVTSKGIIISSMTVQKYLNKVIYIFKKQHFLWNTSIFSLCHCSVTMTASTLCPQQHSASWKCTRTRMHTGRLDVFIVLEISTGINLPFLVHSFVSGRNAPRITLHLFLMLILLSATGLVHKEKSCTHLFCMPCYEN